MAKVKAHRRVPSDKRVNRGNPTQKGEQVGEKTFGVICQRERVFPKSLAKPRSSGEIPSRTESSCPAWRSRANQASDPHPNPLPQGERGWLPWCNALRLLHPTVLPQGRGNGYRGRLRSANRSYSTLSIDPKVSPARGEWMVTVVQYAPLIAPYRLPHASHPHGAWAKPRRLTRAAVEGATLAPCRRRGRPAGLSQRRCRP